MADALGLQRASVPGNSSGRAEFYLSPQLQAWNLESLDCQMSSNLVRLTVSHCTPSLHVTSFIVFCLVFFGFATS